jgi:hypothetical protein
LKLEVTNAGKRSVVDRIEDAAASAGVQLPEGWKPEVARRLASKWAISDAGKADTEMLDRAQKLFKVLNERFGQSA